MRVSGPRLIPFFLAGLLFLSTVPTGHGVENDPTNRWADIQGFKSGDHWDFRVSGQENGDIHNEIVGVANKKNLFGKTVQSYLIEATGTLESNQRPSGPVGLNAQPGQETSITIEIDVKKWVRTTDYAVHHIEGTTKVEGKPTNSSESFDPPFVEVVFPFQEDYKWRSRSNYKLERGSEPQQGSEFSDTVTVLGKETVTVPAGTFDAWKLHFSSGREYSEYKLQWYSEETCDIVKEERYGNDGTLINTMELTDYKCSRTEKENPVYDPDFVVLLATGEPWDDGSGETDSPTQFQPGTTGTAGISFWWIALALLGGATGVMLVVRRRS